MPYILGTAGHVDHGKTALIKALTGTETSHLPEEKKRGMTIELGFAAFKDSQHGLVGIVDVPGHERFIRNMTAGTWGLDAALLIVAADDGWMQMSEDHLRVLKAMHINSILLVITKADLVEPDLLQLVSDDANSHCEKIIGRKLPCTAVSSLTGFGMQELKTKISELLISCKKKEADVGFLYVDRVFVLKGIGTTVTGTLRGQKLKTGDLLNIYPSGEECRIKSIQNHHNSVEEISPGSRTALNLKLGEKVVIERGMLITGKKTDSILNGKELIIRIDECFKDSKYLKNHSEMEIALGSTHSIGKLHFNQFDKSLCRLSLDSPIACLWNQPAVLIRHGGSEILASCRILAAFELYKKAKFKESFQVYRNRELPSVYSYRFYCYGFLEKNDLKIEDITVDKTEVFEYSSIYFLANKLNEWEKEILEFAAGRQAGFTIEETAQPIPAKIKAVILKKLHSENKLENSGHIYKLKGKTESDISKNAKIILDMALQSGFDGIEIDKLSIPQARKEVRDLVKLGHLVCLENFLYYHKSFYDKAVNKLFKNLKKDDIITIASARDSTNLSRKYILPILNILEKEGKLKRSGNERIVL